MICNHENNPSIYQLWHQLYNRIENHECQCSIQTDFWWSDHGLKFKEYSVMKCFALSYNEVDQPLLYIFNKEYNILLVIELVYNPFHGFIHFFATSKWNHLLRSR